MHCTSTISATSMAMTSSSLKKRADGGDHAHYHQRDGVES